MLEAAIPALWSTVHGWFTPAVLFLVLNLVIGTIAVTSKVTAVSTAGGAGDGAGGQNRKLSRVPSMALDRLRSFNLSRLAAPAAEAPVSGVLDLGSDDQHPTQLEKEEGQGEIFEHEHTHAHMERSRSEAAEEVELPPLPSRMRKSASEKSAFAHFVVEEDTEAVEARRPATTRDAAPRRQTLAAEPEEPDSEDEMEEPAAGAGEVDARADDFINKFHHQLKLQRIDSFMRYRDTLRRGQTAAAAAVAGTE